MKRTLRTDFKIQIAMFVILYFCFIGLTYCLRRSFLASCIVLLFAGFVGFGVPFIFFSGEKQDERDCELLGRAAEKTIGYMAFPSFVLVTVNFCVGFAIATIFSKNREDFAEFVAILVSFLYVSSVQLLIYLPRIMKAYFYLKLEKKDRELLGEAQ